jgi:lipoic acid synthetase
MTQLKVIQERKPDWLKVRLPTGEGLHKYGGIRETLKGMGLVTVCEEALCPNINECWGSGTATFMVMGDTCTRGCKFCNVKTAANGQKLDPLEPEKIAKAVKEWGLKYIVVTSVDRDDLADQGAGHFAECIREIKKQRPETIVEVLIPDFRGNEKCIDTIIEAKPDVIAHNIETVKELQSSVRDRRANYEQSLSVLRHVKKNAPEIFTKSSIMLGLGETDSQLFEAMDDLRKNNVDILTLGQYLRPSSWHLEVKEFVRPEKFAQLKEIGEQRGFAFVAAGPFVRSSYKAGEFFVQNIIEKRKSSKPEKE